MHHLDKLKVNSVLLKDHVGHHKIRRGVLTGFNEAFVIDSATRDRLLAEDPKSTEIIKPFLVGEDARRYAATFRGRYLIWTYIGVPINQYPAIFAHLQQHQEQLEKRWDKGNHWWELRHCDYYADFKDPKIIYPNICYQPEFAIEDYGYYSNQKTFIIPVKDMYLLALLNSKVMKFIFKMVLPKLRGNFFEPSYVFMKDIPIRCINYVTSGDKRAYYRDKARLLYQQCLQEQGKPDCIMDFVDHQLTQQPEASDVVHDLLEMLAEEMSRLNKQKHNLQQEFLICLVNMLRIKPDKDGRAGIEVLTGKSRLLDYIGDYQKGEEALSPDGLWELVCKNRARVEANLMQTSLKTHILTTYQESLDKILPLKEQLQYTDALIDAVVYRLYGLTKDEILVVEGE